MRKQLLSCQHTPFVECKIAVKPLLRCGQTAWNTTFKTAASAQKGIYAGPLRLLAYEVFDRLNRADVLCSLLTGEESIPSIEPIYDLGAQWPEREINELIGVTFEGLDTSKRLFMPESMLEGQGQIFVTPMEELIKNTQVHDEVH